MFCDIKQKKKMFSHSCSLPTFKRYFKGVRRPSVNVLMYQEAREQI